MEFELIGVRANFWTYSDELTIRDVDINLDYVCISKLPKTKRDKLEEVKEKYKNGKRLERNNYKIPIWHEL